MLICLFICVHVGVGACVHNQSELSATVCARARVHGDMEGLREGEQKGSRKNRERERERERGRPSVRVDLVAAGRRLAGLAVV